MKKWFKPIQWQYFSKTELEQIVDTLRFYLTAVIIGVGFILLEVLFILAFMANGGNLR